MKGSHDFLPACFGRGLDPMGDDHNQNADETRPEGERTRSRQAPMDSVAAMASPITACSSAQPGTVERCSSVISTVCNLVRSMSWHPGSDRSRACAMTASPAPLNAPVWKRSVTSCQNPSVPPVWSRRSCARKVRPSESSRNAVTPCRRALQALRNPLIAPPFRDPYLAAQDQRSEKFRKQCAPTNQRADPNVQILIGLDSRPRAGRRNQSTKTRQVNVPSLATNLQLPKRYFPRPDLLQVSTSRSLLIISATMFNVRLIDPHALISKRPANRHTIQG